MYKDSHGSRLESFDATIVDHIDYIIVVLFSQCPCSHMVW